MNYFQFIFIYKLYKNASIVNFVCITGNQHMINCASELINAIGGLR